MKASLPVCIRVFIANVCVFVCVCVCLCVCVCVFRHLSVHEWWWWWRGPPVRHQLVAAAGVSHEHPGLAHERPGLPLLRHHLLARLALHLTALHARHGLQLAAQPTGNTHTHTHTHMLPYIHTHTHTRINIQDDIVL